MSNVTKQAALDALETLTAYLNQEGEESAAETVKIPTVDEVKEIAKDDLATFATSLGLDAEDKKPIVLRALLTTLAKVAADEELGEDDEVDELAEALGLTPDKKPAKTIAAIKEWAESLGSVGEESTEDDSTETSDEETKEEDADEETKSEDSDEDEKTEDADSDESEPAKEEDTSQAADTTTTDDDSDNVDREVVAKRFKKFPDTKTMLDRLAKYNAKADTEIEFDKKDPKNGYRQLVAELVDSSEQIAEWGVAYVRDNEGWCCGLPLIDVKMKGKTAGKCAVTGKIFVLNDEQTGFDEYKK